MHIEIRKGLTIPLQGAPTGMVRKAPECARYALDLSCFGDISFTLLNKLGDTVLIGQPLAMDKRCEGRMFVSPASGRIVDIVRGPKRKLLSIIVENDGKDQFFSPPKGDIIQTLLHAGIFAYIRKRPCDVLADPQKLPRAIFVKAIESAPFIPPAELSLQGKEKFFQKGLSVLSELAPVHVIYRKNSDCKAFGEAKGVQLHTASGPHPIGNASIHIEHVAPIVLPSDIIWTVTAEDVWRIGRLFEEGIYDPRRIIGVGGAIDDPGFYEVRLGVQADSVVQKKGVRLVSGDPLMGSHIPSDGYLGFYHKAFSAIAEPSEKREFLHFLRLRRGGFTATKTYMSKSFGFTTLLHGEERAFVDGSLYTKVMPLALSPMLLVKAVLAEDYEKAVDLGLLEVSPEDFALPAFICPSKIEMVDIIEKGLQLYASQYLGQ